jgi:hypothetical protein
MRITRLLLLLLLLNIASATGQNKSKFIPQLDLVLRMLNTKDVKVAQSVLHKDYIIAGIFPGAEEQVLIKLFAQLPKFDGYTIVSEQKEERGTRICLHFTQKESADKFPSNFLIDNNGIITELNLSENAKIETKFR